MKKNQWTFTDELGSFSMNNPESINELYFPLCNELGLMSSITPVLHGDMKQNQHNFMLLPTSLEDLHNSKASRNFWLYVEDKGPWSVSGNSAMAHTNRFDSEQLTNRKVDAGLLWHQVTYTDTNIGIESKILNFIPVDNKVEIMKVTITNISKDPLILTPTSAIPIYGRSADNIRDHRHVTSLVNRTTVSSNGISMQPVILFDETGHKYNHVRYFVYGSDETGAGPIGVFPTVEDFIGSKGDLEWPEAVVTNKTATDMSDVIIEGKETVAALRFEPVTLAPSKSIDYIIVMGIGTDTDNMNDIFELYNSSTKVAQALQKNKDHWIAQATKVTVESGLSGFSNWLKWVEVQPVFRKIFGCSFLPSHDYGKGGRGWRDLWQDCLSLTLLQPEEVESLLINNYGGVRIDGTNATIIGNEPGEFIADRNNIPRVWMDHGSWPYLTTKLYIDQSGDMEILLKEQTYFRDSQIKRAREKDDEWSPNQGRFLKDRSGLIYSGSVIEHILVQHLTSFFNVGEHNIIRLEGADWNDTLDMARERGESTAFTALYGSNLLSIAKLLRDFRDSASVQNLMLFEELAILLDSSNDKSDYNDIDYKHALLDTYFDSVSVSLSGTKHTVPIDRIIDDLEAKGSWIITHLREQEYMTTSQGDGFYNGYYNNDG
ncbi:MAG: cellobiose phosphorylase, partial [Vallitaleaceae bacterium]|nr:cellobiose phosphorylase [Vallitaleaceae bacterium]